MSELIAQTRGLDIGRAFADAFRVVGQRWPAILVIVLAVGWVPQTAIILGYTPLTAALGPAARGLWASIGVTLAVLFVTIFMRTAVTAVALAPETRFSTSGALASAAAAIPALFPLWLITSVPDVMRTLLPRLSHMSLVQQAMTAGMVAWPLAVILALTVGVASSVAVVGRRGFIGTMARAARLMSAGRWGFFGLFLLFQALVVAVAFGAILVLSALHISAAVDPTTFSELRSISAELLSDGVQALWAIVGAMCYRQFRHQIDGPSANEAADIFS